MNIKIRLAIASHFLASILFVVMVIGWQTGWSGELDGYRLEGHVPFRAIAKAKALGRMATSENLTLAISLPLRNAAELENLIDRQQNSNDPEYGKYLTTEEFTARFAPSQADYQKVVAHFKAQGFMVMRRHANRLLLTVKGNVNQTESALNVKLQRYQDPTGREFFAPDNNPKIPGTLAHHILHISGLSSSTLRHTDVRQFFSKTPKNLAAAGIGTGPQGGLTPSDIALAYNSQPSKLASAHPQTLALLEMADFYPSDISYYQNYFNLSGLSVQSISVDGGATRLSRHRSSQSSETTLDIQLQMALAPADSTILVYEGPNTDTGFLDILNQIATDNTAKQISCSWGSDEGSNTASYLQSENQIFQQMAAQGQSFYSAAGDSGAYDNGSTISVDDPASQPYVTGVGGTQLSLLTNGVYDKETTWNNGSIADGAGGGGISSVWPIPAYQQGIATAASTTKRNVPDVSLNADPNTGYAIFYRGSWSIFGGTSCAAPLWAAYTAQINQERLTNGGQPLGFMNPRLYALGNNTGYGTAFHDIADKSTNLKYVASTGYDNATGWGSFNGLNLLTDLSVDAPVLKPSVIIVTPNGGELLKAKSAFLVQWRSENIATKKRLNVSFSKNNGVKWTALKTGVKVTGGFQWKPTKAQRTSQGLMRICLPKSGKTAAVCDVSDAVFSIQ